MADGLKNPDRHRDPGVLARPSAELREEAKKVLAAEGWSMNDFLVACLVLLTRNPKAMLARLAEFRPTPRRGRPKKDSEG